MNGAGHSRNLGSRRLGRAKGAVNNVARRPRRRLRAWAAKLMLAGLIYRARGRIKKGRHRLRGIAST